MTNYSELKVGDRVYFHHVHDPRHPERVERHVGIVSYPWRVLVNKTSGVFYTVTDKNYIEHKSR